MFKSQLERVGFFCRLTYSEYDTVLMNYIRKLNLVSWKFLQRQVLITYKNSSHLNIPKRVVGALVVHFYQLL